MFFLTLNTAIAHAGDFKSLLLSQAKESLILRDTNVEIIVTEDNKYLVSVGVAQFNPSIKKSKLSAIRSSMLRAEDAAVKFFSGSNIKVNEHLYSTDTSDTLNVVQKEFSGGDTGTYINLGEWINDDLYYTAIAYPLLR